MGASSGSPVAGQAAWIGASCPRSSGGASRAGLIALLVMAAAAACTARPGQGGAPAASTRPGAEVEAAGDASASATAATATAPRCAPGDEDPADLACTGLYAGADAGALAEGVRAFKPGFELWSDGAEKTRWIYLPPGSRIDASRMNDWVFPVGTKLWKEFRVPATDGRMRRVETRLLWKQAEDRWLRAVYAWSEDGARATQVKEGVARVAGTEDYGIPAQTDCVRCHAGRVDNVLGFEAIQLAAPEASGLTYAELLRLGLLDAGGNAAPTVEALQVPGSAIERPALGWLHVNCGVSCHHPRGFATHFQMRLEVGADGEVGGVAASPVFATAINQPAKLRPAGAPAKPAYYRVRPGDPARSMVMHGITRRDAPGAPPEQMPPLATRRVDEAGVAAVRAWIAAMTPALGYPRPAP